MSASITVTCPHCGAPVTGRERRPNGNLFCENGHRIRSGEERFERFDFRADPNGWTEATYRAFWDVCADEQDGMAAYDAEEARRFAEEQARREAIDRRIAELKARKAAREAGPNIDKLDAAGLIDLIDKLDVAAFKDGRFSAMILQRIAELDRMSKGKPASAAAQTISEYANMLQQAKMNWQPGIPEVKDQLGDMRSMIQGKTADMVIADDPAHAVNKRVLEAQLKASIALEDARLKASIEEARKAKLAEDAARICGRRWRF